MSGLIRLVISDTGSGHRACADALDGRADVDIVDPWPARGCRGDPDLVIVLHPYLANGT